MDLRRMGNPQGDPENLDTTPVAMPAGYCRPTPIQEILARMVKEAIEVERGEEFETEEEADDFEEEDPAVLDMSPYTFENIQDDYIPDHFLASEPPTETAEPPEAPPTVGEADQTPPDGEIGSELPNSPAD